MLTATLTLRIDFVQIMEEIIAVTFITISSFFPSRNCE